MHRQDQYPGHQKPGHNDAGEGIFEHEVFDIRLRLFHGPAPNKAGVYRLHIEKLLRNHSLESAIRPEIPLPFEDENGGESQKPGVRSQVKVLLYIYREKRYRPHLVFHE